MKNLMSVNGSGFMLKFFAILLIYTLTLTACYNDSPNETFTVSGTIIGIDTNGSRISIEKGPINVKNISEYKVGQIVTATLTDTTSNDCWCPDDFVVEEIEVINQ